MSDEEIYIENLILEGEHQQQDFKFEITEKGVFYQLSEKPV